MSDNADFAYSVAGHRDVIAAPKFEGVEFVVVETDDIAVAGFPDFFK